MRNRSISEESEISSDDLKKDSQESFFRHLSFRSLFRSLWKLCANTILYVLALACGLFEVLWFYIRQKFLGYRLPNYHVVDNVLYRGGQPSTSGLRQLAKEGVKTIINLRTEDFNKKVIEEYHSDQIRTVHIPFYPYEPQDCIMIDFLKIMLNPHYKPVFVHCFHGADRTGAVCAIYRIVVQNWDKEKAITEMKRKGLHWWHNNLVDYIRNLDVEAIRSQL